MAGLQKDSFLTMCGFSQGELKIKGSRFIASALPVMSEEAALEFIEKMSSEFRDATHNCFAYKIGLENAVRTRYSDAGEPSGTAGSAILSAIESAEITNVAIVVSRYFGGTKLGVGPLRRAYRDSARSVMEGGRVELRYLTRRYSFAVPYAEVKEVKSILKRMNASIVSEEYLDEPKFIVDVRKSLAQDFERRFKDTTRGRIPQPLND